MPKKPKAAAGLKSHLRKVQAFFTTFYAFLINPFLDLIDKKYRNAAAPFVLKKGILILQSCLQMKVACLTL